MVSLLHSWQALADELCQWTTFTSTGTSASTSSILCSTLIDDSVEDTHYNGHFVYALSGTLKEQQRVVTRKGFLNSTGRITVSREFASTPASGVSWAILDRFPVIQHDRTPGLREFINRGLRDIVIHSFIRVQGVDQQSRYLLPSSTNWWITEPGRIINVWQPYPNSTDRRAIDARDWELIFDGESITLQLTGGFSSSDTFELEVWRPANSRLRTGGAWQDQSSPVAGLSVGTDETAAPLSHVLQAGLEYAYRHIAQDPGLAAAKSFWENEYKKQRAKNEVLKLDYKVRTAPNRKPNQFVGSSSGEPL